MRALCWQLRHTGAAAPGSPAESIAVCLAPRLLCCDGVLLQRCIALQWLRLHVALVSQEPVLFARSISRNICYGLEAEDGCTSPPTQVCVVLSCLR